MGFKVGVPLWVSPPADNRSGPMAADSGAGFRDKLGLPERQAERQATVDSHPCEQVTTARIVTQAETSAAVEKLENPVVTADALLRQQQLAQRPMESTMHHLLASAQEASLTRALVAPSSSTQGTGIRELYSLGLQAGHHLSHLPQIFMEAQQTASAAPPRASVQDLNTGSSRLAAAVLHASAQSASTVVGAALAGSSPGARLSGTEATLAPRLLSYLSGKYPDRHCQVLPHGEGIELLIRDYHLAPAEQEALVADLLVRLASMPKQPEHIWVNGQHVWHSELSLHTSRGEPYGD